MEGNSAKRSLRGETFPGGLLHIDLWFPALACIALLIYVLSQRASSSEDTSVKRLALLTGTRRAWGESDVSLRRRSIALSRWPYTKEEPEVAWWARLFGRVLRRFSK
jgi:hypothetical protein